MELKRGVNIEGWLNHRDRPGSDDALSFTARDARRVAGLGFDHLRINVNEQSLWDEDGKPAGRGLELVNDMLDECSRLGLKAVFDLHILRSHYFNAPERPLFDDPACVERFVDCWRRLSDFMRERPVDEVAYELLNEPVADDPEDWNRVYVEPYRMLREREPDRVVVLGSNAYSSPEAFRNLRVPPGDPNLVLTFHFYKPFLFTHHAVVDRHDGLYDGPVHYPGYTFTDADIASMTDRQRDKIVAHNRYFDRAALSTRMQPAIEVAAEHGLPVYCGEWGCYDTVPRPDRLRWHADMISVLAGNGAGWAVYAYRGRWGAVWRDGTVDEELVQILLR